MRGAVVEAIVRGAVRRTSPAGAWVVGLLLGLAGMTGELRAQNIISVPFTNGFIGSRGSSAGTANNVLTYATLGIARTFFIQSSSTNAFELQGNDIPGTLRIVRSNGTTLDIPASANWRNSGGSTYLIGILPRPTSPITFAYSGGSIQITDGSAPGGSSVGGYVARYSGATLADGQSDNGNAAASQVRDGLNDYLATVVSSRPAGPVTVSALTTTSTTPTLTGTATLGTGESLSVVFEGVQYTGSTTPAVTRAGTAWSLALATPLAVGTYSVTATITDADGFTLSDATSNELVIAAPTTAVTLGGGFTANGRTYDGTTAATGTTSGLTLVGVTAPDQVSIASVTLAFQSAAAGVGRTVVITAVTLGGANAARYTVSLSGAPTATATITPKALTIAGVTAASRPYDGTTVATLAGTASYAGLVAGESFAVAGTPTASFATAAVGTGKAVTAAGYAAPSANYTVAQPSGLTASVTAKPLTIGGAFTAASRPYDGTTAATIASSALTLVGVVGSDAVSLSGVAAAFADATVGTAKPVSLSAAGLAGAAAGNYTLGLAGAPTTTADITSAGGGGTVTVAGSFTANGRTYDGTTAASGSTAGLTLVGVTAPDQVSIAAVTLAFQSAAVGTGKTVVITGVTLGGANAGQYTASLAGAPTATAAITPKPLTIGGAFTAASRPFDGTTAATIDAAGLALVGVVSGDAVSPIGVTAAFADAAVGTAKPVSLTAASLAGAAAGQYTLSLAGAPTTTADIMAAAAPTPTPAPTPAPTGGPVTIGGGFTADHKTYDGLTVATGTTSGLTLAGVHAPDQVSIAAVTLAFQTPTVGTAKTVVITAVTLAGADAARYTVSLAGAPTATANVTARPLTIAGAFTAASRPYDGTTTATLSTNALWLAGVLGGHDVKLANVTAAFADAAVGVDKPVTLRTATLAGTMAGNYTLALAGAPTTTASIVAATPPSAPRAVASTAGDGRLAVTWAAPESEGCRAVIGYVVEHSADEGRSWSRTTVAAAPTAATLAGLSNNVGYRVRVAAVNACGTGPFSAAVGPVVPVAPVPDESGRPVVSAPGTATGTAGGVRTPVTTEVVQDTIVRVAAGDFTLRLRAVDQPGAVIPVDSTRTLQLEHGGRANADGSGFAPGTWVTLYLFGATGDPMLLGTVPVGPDGVFAASVPVPDALAAGDYTLQVNGIDRASVARSVALGVEVVPPPPELVLAATPDQPSPAVGDTITITLTVTNEGRGAAIDVVIPRAFTEPGFTIVHASPLEGTYHAASQEWTIGRIEPGARARMRLTAIVLPPAAPQESTR